MQRTLHLHLSSLIADIDLALAVRQGDDTRAVLRETRERIARLLAKIEARAAEKEAPRERRGGDVRDLDGVG
jgi:hypothetical protein